ncbi:MAG TPA: AMP-binding protein [Terriglobales bacterium]|nr:AMP-binding protein [Terriglobales bacterium]
MANSTTTVLALETPAASAPVGAANFYRRFLETVERWPDHVAVEMQRSDPAKPVERHTYAELRRDAESIGRWLAEQGLERGARCAILASNGPRWVAAYLGAVAAGMVAVPLDIALKPEQVARLLADSGSTVLFVDGRHLAAGERAASGLKCRIVLLELEAEGKGRFPNVEEMFAAGPGDFTPVDTALDETVLLLYTSGTTADPKGVVLTNDNLLAEVEAVFKFIQVTPKDSILGVLPLFHALAQMANLLLPFAAGARVVYLEQLNTSELMRALRERDVTLFCCVPQFFYLIHERILKQVKERGALAQAAFRVLMGVSRLGRRVGINLGKVFFKKAHQALGTHMRFLITGGSRFDAAIGRDLEAMGFDILQAYGLTETSGGAFATPIGQNVIGSVGKPLYGVEARLADTQASEDEEGPAAGEILIRSRIVMKGYYKRPEATAEVLRDGWLYTGDLGYFDEDGNLFITGRKKDVIVLSSGKNIYPEEIEAHYQQSPWIKEVCVLGLESRPGEPFAERLHAVIVPDFELLKQKKIVNTREVIRFDLDGLSAQLPPSKRILSFELWQEELPRTTTRKLKRYQIRKSVLEGAAAAEAEASPVRELSSEDAAWLDEPDVQRALRVVREAAREKKESIHPNDNLELDLGLDSMERVELLVALEQELGASVDDSVVSEVYTVRDLVDAVRKGMGAEGAKRASFPGWEAVLATDTDDPEVTAITEPRPISTAAIFLLGRAVNLFLRDAFRLKVIGLEKLPKHGPFLLSPNHQSYLEAPILPTLLPWSLWKDMFYVGTSEIFGEGIFRRIARLIKLIPVDPDANLVRAMRAGAYGLRRGMVLTLYPEGERSIDGRPKTFKKGAAILSYHLQVPIYPVAVEGFYEAWPRGKPFQKFADLKIMFGDPIYPPKKGGNPELVYDQITRELRARVVAMWLKLRGEEPDQADRLDQAAD